MKKLTFVFTLSFLLFSSPIIFAKNITLTDALAKGLVELKVQGEGGHTGKSLQLTIRNLYKKKLKISIPAGMIFNSEDTTRQDLMLIEERILAIDGHKNRISKMYAVCIEAKNGSPRLGDKFNIGALAVGHLLNIAQFIAKEKMYRNSAAQYAVWAVSDSKRVENIDNGKLANHVADLLGKPRPEYVILHKTTSRPGEPAYREAPSVLKGRFRFELKKAQLMTFGLYTKDGKLMHAFFKKKRKLRGQHKFSFTFRVFNMPQGDYVLRLVSGGKVIKEKEVRF